MEKFSPNLIYAAVNFMREVKEEIGQELADEKVIAMFDAFDPALKQQVLLDLLLGKVGGDIKLRRTYDFHHHYKKIPMIKAVRKVTGLGLKEAKDIVDGFGEEGIIKGNFTSKERREFKEITDGCGYEVI